MVNWRGAIPILLALVIAIVGSVYIYRWIERQTGSQQTVQVKSDEIQATPVVVATMDLAAGTAITEEMLKTSPFLKNSLPGGYFDSIEKVKGRVLTASLKTGEAVLEHRLAPTDVKSGGVSVIVPKGKRAVAVKGNKVMGVSGFINPGNRVDVLLTIGEKTKTVMENMLVLATGTLLERNEEGVTSPVDVYTLEVTPEEAESLTVIASKGDLQFALRNVLDEEEVLTRGATVDESLKAFTAAAPSNEEKRWAPVTTTTIEVIKGASVSKEEVKL